MDAGSTRKQIGKYDVLEVLGRGGMGVVYKAMDSRIKRLVAIKMMTGEVAKDPDYLKRFYREAQSTGILQHPNIVVVYDLGDEEGNPYLVMEYLEGITLDKVIAARSELLIYDKLNILIQVLEGLAYAHQRGIVHRDIKPQNIMVLRDRTVKIVDFGIARMGNTGLTKTGQVIGTITYMSPEQINAAAVDGRSDIFSAAVVL
jgi:serine/threonine-protein kinase